MKVLMIVPDLVVGGVTTVVLNIINGLKKRNIEVKLVSLFDHCEVDIENIDYQTLGLKSVFDIPKSIIQMRKIIDSFKPDLVHSHTLYSHLLIFFCSYIKKNYKLIASDHGTYTAKLKFYKRMYLFKLMNPIADLLTNVSNASCESYINQNIVSPDKIRTMYNGVDIKKYKYSAQDRISIRSELKINDHTKVIGFVGRISIEKNLPNLINAVELLNLDYKLVIIGDGPELVSIRKLVDEKKLGDFIIFLGEIKNPSSYYSVFDVLVLSSDTEGLPTVILEAIASKCLVVATDCGGVKEIFPANYNYIVPTNNHITLYQRINNILKLNNFEKEFIKDTCYESLLAKFSVEKANKVWWSLYSEI